MHSRRVPTRRSVIKIAGNSLTIRCNGLTIIWNMMSNMTSAWQKGQDYGQSQRNRKQSLPKMKQYFCFLSISGIFCHMQCYTNDGVQENGCFILGKQCSGDWQLILKHSSTYLQSDCHTLQHRTTWMKSHLAFPNTVFVAPFWLAIEIATRHLFSESYFCPLEIAFPLKQTK